VSRRKNKEAGNERSTCQEDYRHERALGDPVGLLFELADEDTNSVDGPPDPVGTLSSSFTNSRSP
jgi:hypothetical protein